MFRITLCLVLLFAVFLFSACPKTIKIFPSDNFTKEARSKYQKSFAELERNRKLWEASKIEDYNFEIGYYTMVGCTCSPASFKVRDGKMISIEEVPQGWEYYEPEKIETIEKTFDFVKQRLNDDQIIDAQYNQSLGYPERVIIKSSDNIDAQSFFEMTKFEITK
jgi:Family of unknown function (DUF6174)